MGKIPYRPLAVYLLNACVITLLFTTTWLLLVGFELRLVTDRKRKRKEKFESNSIFQSFFKSLGESKGAESGEVSMSTVGDMNKPICIQTSRRSEVVIDVSRWAQCRGDGRHDERSSSHSVSSPSITLSPFRSSCK